MLMELVKILCPFRFFGMEQPYSVPNLQKDLGYPRLIHVNQPRETRDISCDRAQR